MCSTLPFTSWWSMVTAAINNTCAFKHEAINDRAIERERGRRTLHNALLDESVCEKENEKEGLELENRCIGSGEGHNHGILFMESTHNTDRRLGALRCLIIVIEIRANNHWRNSDRRPSTVILLRQMLVLYNLQCLSSRRCNFRCLTRHENLQGRMSASYSHSRKAVSVRKITGKYANYISLKTLQFTTCKYIAYSGMLQLLANLVLVRDRAFKTGPGHGRRRMHCGYSAQAIDRQETRSEGQTTGHEGD